MTTYASYSATKGETTQYPEDLTVGTDVITTGDIELIWTTTGGTFFTVKDIIKFCEQCIRRLNDPRYGVTDNLGGL